MKTSQAIKFFLLPFLFGCQIPYVACSHGGFSCVEGFHEIERENGFKGFHYFGGTSSDTERLRGLFFKRIEAVCGGSFIVKEFRIQKEVTTGGNPPWEAYALVRCGGV